MAKRRKAGRRGFGSIYRKGAMWWVRVRVQDGVRTRPDGTTVPQIRSIARSAGPTRSHAEALLETLRRENADADVFGKAPPTPAVSLADFRPVFEAARRGHAPETRRKDAQRYDAIAQHFGAKALCDVRRPDIDDYCGALAAHTRCSCTDLAKCEHPGMSGATVNRYVALLSAIFKAAVERELAEENPCRGIRRKREALRDVTVVSVAELDRLAAAIDADLRPAVVLACETGARRSELAALLWTDLDLAARPYGALLVRRGKSARARRALPLTTKARSVVDALLEERGALPMRGAAPLLPVLADRAGLDRITKAVPQAAADAGLPRLRLHDLRHLLAVRLLRAGTPLSDVAALLGDSLAVATRYARHVPADFGAAAVQRLEAAEATRPATKRKATSRL